MNRNYKLDKETTQRLLDLAVEDNLVKLHKKVGTKGEPISSQINCDTLCEEKETLVTPGFFFLFHILEGLKILSRKSGRISGIWLLD
jgi:hypothetical protein